MRPEDAYSDKRVFGLRKVLEKYSKSLLLRQGENGAPSTFIPSFALSNIYWTEYTQAKYNMRRLLGDLGNDIETSVFTIIDIYYKPVLNTKGLIESDVTMAAIRPKVAYYAVQNIASIFDNSLVLKSGFKHSTTNEESLSVYGYQHKVTKNDLVVLWLDGENASNSFKTTAVTITFDNCNLKNPVWVDLMTGSVHEITSNQITRVGSSFTFTNIPLYDAPIMIVDRGAVNFKEL